MDDILFVYILFGVLFIFVIYAFLKLPYRHKQLREEAEQYDQYYELDEIDKEIPLEKKIGKLVRKNIDKTQERRYNRYGMGLYTQKKDYYWKYYLTFETFQGYKSFTVTKEEFKKVSINTYGYIYYQDTRYSHFVVRNREDLHLDELIKKHYQE